MKHKKKGMILLFAILLALLFCGSVQAADTNNSAVPNADSISNTKINSTDTDPVISGKITVSPTNQSLNGVLITIRDTGGTILAQTLTGSDGTYTTNFANPATVYRVTASKVGYNSYTKQITVSKNPANPSDPNLYGTANIRLQKIPAYSGNSSGYILNLGALSDILLDLYAGKSSARVNSTASPYATGGGTPLEVKLLNGSLLSGLLDVYSSGDDGAKIGGINPENLPALLQTLGLKVGLITAQGNSSTNPPQSSGGSEVASVELSLLQLIEVINLNLISSNSAVTPNFNTGTLLSSSGNGVTSISVLGGVLVIDALQSTATASANGNPGGAIADFHWSVADIKLLGLSILEELTVNGQVTLPGILTISLGAEDEYTSADGTRARASGNALNIELLDLLLGGVKLTLGHAEAAAQVPVGGLDEINADIGITKTVDKTIANLNDLIHYTITVTNNGPDTISGLTVKDILPAGLQLVSYSGNGSYSTGVWTVNNVLTSGASATLNIIARIIDSNITITNVASVNLPSDVYDPNPDNDQDEVTTVVRPDSDLDIVKTVDKTVANLGDVLHYSLTVTNNGPDSISGFTVTDVLHTGLQLVSYNGVGTYVNGVWTINNVLTSGASATLNIFAKVIDSNITITNLAGVNVPGNVHDPDPDNNQDEVTTVVRPDSDLDIVKTVDKTVAKLGDVINYTIKVTNRGPDSVSNITVRDQLSGKLQWISDNSNGAYNRNTGIWTISKTLTSGSQAILTITARIIDSNTSILNTALVNVPSNNHDPNPGNNEDNVTVTVGPASDLGVTKKVNNSYPKYLQNVTFTLTAHNYGPDSAKTVKVTDKLPTGLKFVSADGTYNSSTGVWTIGNLAVGKTATLHILAKMMVSATKLTNVAVVSGANYDPNSANNRATATVSSGAAADLGITKTVNNSRPKYLQNVVFTLTARNYGPNTATGVTVTDKLPAGLKFVSVSGNGKYNAATGAWTIGTLAKNKSATLRITAKASTPSRKLTNSAVISGTTYDPNSANNRASASITVGPAADLAVSITVDNARPKYLQKVRFTITAYNYGPMNAKNVTVTIKLPAGMKYVSNDLGGKFNPKTGVWTIGNLKNGGKVVLHIVGQAMVSNIKLTTTAVIRGTAIL